jgi:hypothetical protein
MSETTERQYNRRVTGRRQFVGLAGLGLAADASAAGPRSKPSRLPPRHARHSMIDDI